MATKHSRKKSSYHYKNDIPIGFIQGSEWVIKMFPSGNLQNGNV